VGLRTPKRLDSDCGDSGGERATWKVRK
jgi:hypothetical protein